MLEVADDGARAELLELLDMLWVAHESGHRVAASDEQPNQPLGDLSVGTCDRNAHLARGYPRPAPGRLNPMHNYPTSLVDLLG